MTWSSGFSDLRPPQVFSSVMQRSRGQGMVPLDMPQAHRRWIWFSAELHFAVDQLFTSPTLLVWLLHFYCISFGEVIELLFMFSKSNMRGCRSCWDHGQHAARWIAPITPLIKYLDDSSSFLKHGHPREVGHHCMDEIQVGFPVCVCCGTGQTYCLKAKFKDKAPWTTFFMCTVTLV